MSVFGIRVVGLVIGFCSLLTAAAWADPKHGTKQDFGMPGKAGKVTRTVHVTTRDMAYQMKPFQVRPGETIRFVVKNTDEVDHDFTIAPPAVQAEHRKEMMTMMESGRDMSVMHKDKNAVFVKPGEIKELVWKFTKVAGIEFACNLPGHYESGMKGVFVEKNGAKS